METPDPITDPEYRRHLALNQLDALLRLRAELEPSGLLDHLKKRQTHWTERAIDPRAEPQESLTARSAATEMKTLIEWFEVEEKGLRKTIRDTEGL